MKPTPFQLALFLLGKDGVPSFTRGDRWADAVLVPGGLVVKLGRLEVIAERLRPGMSN